MKIGLLVSGGLLLVGGVGWFALRPGDTGSIETAHISSVKHLAWKEQAASAGLCPWRSPEEDRKRYFPESRSYRDETLILSSHRLELQKRLGRAPTADDNALIVHRILGETKTQGFVVTRRVRGESGLIELALMTDENGRVLGAKIQRHREPEDSARALQSSAFLGAFTGKDSRAAWRLGQDISEVPPSARSSAVALVQEARSVLVLLDVATHSDNALPPERDPGHHPAESPARR